jgi:diguanylate cyclase (GGDEF)-like protein/PAS domain S-box-containing protein
VRVVSAARAIHWLNISQSLLLLCLLVLPAWAAPPVAAPKQAITIVLDDNYPPYTFRDDHGQLQGILEDTWMLWSKRTGIPVNIRGMDWSLAQKQMQAGHADVIDTLFSTPERLKIYDFSAPYADIDVSIFFHKNISGIVDTSALKGFTVGVKAGDAAIAMLEKRGISNLKLYPSYASLIKAAADGEIVVFCIDRPAALFYLYKMGLDKTFRYSKPLYTGQFHWAVRRGNKELKQQLSNGFLLISAQERREIDRKWLGTQVREADGILTVQHALEALSAIAVVIGVLALWNLSLRRRVASKTAEQTATLHYLSAMLAAIPDLLFEMDIHGTYHDYRTNDPALLNVPANKLLQHNVFQIVPKHAAEAIISALQEAGREGTSHGTQYQLDLPGGAERWFELSVARKQVESGTPERFILISRDITERKKAEAEIRKLAFFDPLTQLPNRRGLQEQLSRMQAAAEDNPHHSALMFIDIDNFKTLNDTRGHRVGDALLRTIAAKMQATLREQDFLGRFGGDEFVVILEQLSTQAAFAGIEAKGIAEQLLAAIRQPCWLENIEYHPSASIGICLFDQQELAHEDEILKRADMAMYRAKSGGRNAVSFFDPSMQARQESRARLDNELHVAVARHQFELYYQAQVDQFDGIIGAEALLRWQHPERGLVPPGQFIPRAEETGLIIPIGQWVIESACAQLQHWQQQPETSRLFISVNVSASQFQQADFVHEVQDTLREYQIQPGKLKFELTESLVLHNVTESIEKMRQLQSMGIKLSLDDFGTGYASLSYLKRLPLNEIKIDRSFMLDITGDHGNAVIVRTIIDMARNFGLEIIAEGIEHAEQRDFLFLNGCRQYQGYLVSRPVPQEQFVALLRQQ